jgi:hypothetical protein
MLTNKKNQFNLTEEILEAAQLLREEQQLISAQKEIANLISDWLAEELQDIEWHYHNSHLLKKKVFNLELNTEKSAADLNSDNLAA